MAPVTGPPDEQTLAGTVEAPTPRRGRRRMVVVAAVALTLAGVIGAVTALTRSNPKPAVRVVAPPNPGSSSSVGSTESTAPRRRGVTTFTDASISQPEGIAAGPDGSLWFANNGRNSIGSISTAGVVTNYSDPTILGPQGITAGPDGALWFTNPGPYDSESMGGPPDSIGRITTSGVVTSYTAPSISGPSQIATGPDGALWFTNYDNNSIGRITATGVVTNFSDPAIASPRGIVSGPDGALWFTNFHSDGSIGRISAAGVVTTYRDASIEYPTSLVVGPDGALWFTNSGPHPSIGRITTAGRVSHFVDGIVTHPSAITTGPDGALWFTSGENSVVGRITTDGTITTFSDPGIKSPAGIVLGPDGDLWIANDASIARVTLPFPDAARTTTTTTSTTTTTTIPAATLQAEACPVGCVGHTIADVDGDGRADQVGVFSTPPQSGDVMVRANAKLTVRVAFADGRVADYDDTADWSNWLVGAADENGDVKAEIFYFNFTGANNRMGHILQWNGSQLAAVRGPDGKPFPTFTSGYAMGGDGFRCTDDSVVVTTLHFDGPPHGWVGSQKTYRWQGDQLVEARGSEPIPIADPHIGEAGDFNVPPEYDQIIGVHCPGMPDGYPYR